MNYKKLIYSLLSVLVIICLTTVNTWAQENKEDVVYLENGSVIRGQVMEYDPNGNIKIEIYGGSILVYKSSEVIKIEKETTKVAVETKKKKRTNHKVPNTGIYGTVSVGTLAGQGDWGNVTPGISLKGVAGWYFHRLLGVGGGIGMMNLGGPTFVPIFANIRGNFMKSTASLFYDINIGYGIGVVNDMYFNGLGQVSSVSGGLYLRPSIGVRLPSTKQTHLFLDFGYVIQFSSSQYSDWSNNPITEKRTIYRPSFRLGITF
jgi:sRNA-binding regulator protein Hfq